MNNAKSILHVDEMIYTHKEKRRYFGTEQGFTLGPISFSMANGETVAVIGNNGSGKTLLAKALAGAVALDSGSIQLNRLATNVENDQSATQSETSKDKVSLAVEEAKTDAISIDVPNIDVQSNDPISDDALSAENEKAGSSAKVQTKNRHKTQDIRLILQHSADALNPSLSIGNILTQTLHLNTKLNDAEKREKIENTLAKVGLLSEHYYYYRHMLSDGQQQRIGLARALILDPKIIVADEPFAALDPSVRSQTINLILKLQKDLGLGFVFISHNIGIVRHISDRVLVLDKGKIVEQGPTTQVFANPQHVVTQKLIQAHFAMVEKHFEQL